MRIFSVVCSVLFAASIAVSAPVHAKNDNKSGTTVQRHPSKAKSAPWHLGWLTSKSKPSTPKPPRCRG